MKFLKNADTSEKRIGAILIIVSSIVLLGSALEWNINRHLFIYTDHMTGVIVAEHPKETPDGYVWRKHDSGWGLFDHECLERNQKPFVNFFDLPLKCQSKFIRFKRWHKTEFRSSFPYFLQESFTKRRTRSWITVPALLILGAGVFLYTGLYSLLVWWIKHGNTPILKVYQQRSVSFERNKNEPCSNGIGNGKSGRRHKKN